MENYVYFYYGRSLDGAYHYNGTVTTAKMIENSDGFARVVNSIIDKYGLKKDEFLIGQLSLLNRG